MSPAATHPSLCSFARRLAERYVRHSPGRPSRGTTKSPPPGGADVVDWRDTPCPCIVVNFPMDLTQGSPIGHSAVNGATRVIVGSARNRADPPSLDEEPSWMKTETIAPAPAGCTHGHSRLPPPASRLRRAALRQMTILSGCLFLTTLALRALQVLCFET